MAHRLTPLSTHRLGPLPDRAAAGGEAPVRKGEDATSSRPGTAARHRGPAPRPGTAARHLGPRVLPWRRSVAGSTVAWATITAWGAGPLPRLLRPGGPAPPKP